MITGNFDYNTMYYLNLGIIVYYNIKTHFQ